MAPAAGQSKRGAYWNSGDDVTLNKLFERREANPNHTNIKDLKPINEKYFARIPYRNFRTNFLKKAALWILEQEKAETTTQESTVNYLFFQQRNDL